MGFKLDDEQPPPVNADVSNLANEILDGAPEVSEHVVSQENTSAGDGSSVSASPDTGAAADVDSTGERFDSTKHASGADGKGVKTARGTWRKRRGSGSRVVTGGGGKSVAVTTVEQSRAETEAKGRMAGMVAANSVFFACSTLMGVEWQPMKTIQKVPAGEGKEITVEFDERAEHEKIWGDWFVATGRTDFPPGVALALALTSYAGKRFTMPETQKRAQSFKEWMAHKWVSWKMKRDKRKADKNARADSGANAERKDSPSKDAREDVSARR